MSSSKTIQLRVSRKTHTDLSKLGSFGESYEDIIRKLLKDQKAASAQDSFDGTKGKIAASPLSPGGNNG